VLVSIEQIVQLSAAPLIEQSTKKKKKKEESAEEEGKEELTVVFDGEIVWSEWNSVQPNLNSLQTLRGGRQDAVDGGSVNVCSGNQHASILIRDLAFISLAVHKSKSSNLHITTSNIQMNWVNKRQTLPNSTKSQRQVFFRFEQRIKKNM
jgi:hypothetical protein